MSDTPIEKKIDQYFGVQSSKDVVVVPENVIREARLLIEARDTINHLRNRVRIADRKNKTMEKRVNDEE